MKKNITALFFALIFILTGCAAPQIAEEDNASDGSEQSMLSSEMESSAESESTGPAADEISAPSSASDSSSASSQKQTDTSREPSKAESSKPPAAESSAASSAPQADTITCTVSIDCKTALGKLPPNLAAMLPSDGVILPETTVTCKKNESVLSMLKRVCKEQNIAVEHDFTGYIRGIAQLYEKDCGKDSGWTYFINGVFVNVGAGGARIKNGDTIAWRYSCETGDTKS